MFTLGIETSCDETAVAVLENDRKILSNLILSQTDLHSYFGGVIPELACRRHLEVISQLVNNSVQEAGISLDDIQLIAVTAGPGLVGALLLGITYAKSLAYTLNVPLVGVNHIAAHLYSNFMEHPDLSPPCIGLIVSGGHTTLVEIKDINQYHILGETLDDAAGEAFDKVAKLLKLDYPGGPIIDNLAKDGNPATVNFPRAMIKQKNYDFSFSGLKTAVVYYVKGYSQYKDAATPAKSVSLPDLVASFQEAVVDQLINKAIRALKDTKHTKLILGGGVSRNSRLRFKLQEEITKHGWKLYLPSPVMCTDNAAMIAGLGYQRYKTKGPDPLDLDADPHLDWNH